MLNDSTRSSRILASVLLTIVLLPLVNVTIESSASAQAPGDLESMLREETSAELAAAASELGDAVRGAILFHQPWMTCTRCHGVYDASESLGPRLTTLEAELSDEHIVEALLLPSKAIRKGFETTTVVTTDGRTLAGIIESGINDAGVIESRDTGGIAFRDPADGSRVLIAADDIEEIAQSEQSIMPEGLANQLTSRQQFLDLVRYLFEVRTGGESRARELQPAPSQYASQPLPEYEAHIDHAGMIRDLDDEALERGGAIYNRLCINCHGTEAAPGSLPTSLRFASGTFRSGSDPYAMYQTLTRGFGLMVPQRWMVPQQKYDVIHYIRETYLKTHNPSQYVEVSDELLAALPAGDTRGPEPSDIVPWEQMDYGPNLIATYEIGDDATNFAHKGNAIRLDAGPGGVAGGHHWIVYDLDTMRVAAAWSGDGFITWDGINFNDRHGVHPRVVGDVLFENPTGPGWAHPSDGTLVDRRTLGRDGRQYGPLPRDWAHYKGMYAHGQETVIAYTVGTTSVLEMPSLAIVGDVPVVQRHVVIDPTSEELTLQIAHFNDAVSLRHLDVAGAGDFIAVTPQGDAARVLILGVSGDIVSGDNVSGDNAGFTWRNDDGNVRLILPGSDARRRFTIAHASAVDSAAADTLATSIELSNTGLGLRDRLDGGPRRWPEVLTTTVTSAGSGGPFAVDTLPRPTDNPWFCRMRLTGLDFFADGDSMAVCSWDGSVWLVRGLAALDAAPDIEGDAVTDGDGRQLTWTRIASGLFQPLGLKIVDDLIHVTCRDQLCRLHDLNGDDEIDYYENFNNDHQVTEHFHEFAMGLQADDEGNFYYAKSARHALKAVVPHHGTLLRVSPDGLKTEIIANGFRAANGVCLNPDGTFYVTDQEGHWNPKNRINRVREGGFYGNMFGYHDVTDASDEAMLQPLCWITNAFDRSPAELLWVDSDRWGPLDGSLLNLSYGYGKVYIVPHEAKGDLMQGGMCQLPIPQFPTGTMRGRFRAADGQLYLCGMFAWGGAQQTSGGLYRVRYTGVPVPVPVGLKAKGKTITLDFPVELDRESARDVNGYEIKTWSLVRTANYGSDHHNTRDLSVARASISRDGRSVSLHIPELATTWCMEIRYTLRDHEGGEVHGIVHNTIHWLD